MPPHTARAAPGHLPENFWARRLESNHDEAVSLESNIGPAAIFLEDCQHPPGLRFDDRADLLDLRVIGNLVER